MSGGKDGGGQPDEVTQKTEPWGKQKPYLKRIFREAESQFNQGQIMPAPYGGQRVAPFSPESEAAMGMQTQRALMGSPVTDQAQMSALETMRGDYLDPQGNEALRNVLDYSMSKALPGADAGYASAGRYGSGAWGNTRGEAAQEAAASVYNQERQRQMQAMGMSPQLAQQDYRDISALSEVGTQRENLAQQNIQADMQRYLEQGNLPYEALQRYAGMVQGNYGGTTTSQQPGMERNPLSGAVGGAASGAGLAGMLGASTPWTAAAAGLGGLLGLF